MIHNISTALLVTGKIFCFLYFLLELLDQVTRDNFTIESFIKAFAKLIIMFVLFDEKTLNAFLSFGSAIESKVLDLIYTGTYEAGYVSLAKMIIKMEKTNWIKCLGLLFEKTMPSLTMLISMVVVLLVALGRMIEIVVYQALLPLGMASIYNGGLNSPGFRYFKKYLALHLQGAIMLLAVVLASSIGGFLYDEFLALGPLVIVATVFDLIIALATAMIVARSKSIANDVMGV